MDFYMGFEYLLNPNKRIFIIYLAICLAIAYLYLLLYGKEKRLIFSKALWLHSSAILDYKYFFISYIIKAFIILPVIISISEVSGFIYFHMKELFGYTKIDISYINAIILYSILVFIVNDFTRYWTHRFLHTFKFLWRFHKVHHSAKVLNPLTFYRVHPVENILFGFRYSIFIGITTGVFFYFFGYILNVYSILGANISVVIFSIIGSNLRHSHIKLSYPRVLENILISPKQHQVHHSKKHFNKNYGSSLALWDKIFGTLLLSHKVKFMKFGLKKEQMKDYQSIYQLLITPFRK